MSSEVEIERLIVRLMGDGSSYQSMLAEATAVTDQLSQEMKRLGGTEAEFSAITARAAAVTHNASQALDQYSFEANRLRALLITGRLSQENFNMLMAGTRAIVGPATEAVSRFTKQVERGVQVTRGSETALEAYKRKIAELDSLVAAGAITQETYNRVAEQLNNQLPRTIALRQQEAAAVRAAAQAHREAERAVARASAQSQRAAAVAERQLAAAIREGANAERQMVREGQAASREMARRATHAQADAERELARVRKQGEAVTREMMTAQERYATRIAHLNYLLQRSAISEQTHSRAIIAAQRAMRESLVVTSNLGKEVSRAGLSLRGFGTSWSIYVTAPLTAFLAAGTMAGVKMDSLTRGLTAITHSSAKTKKELESMLDVAKLPGLGFKEAVEGDIRLQATGFSAGLAKRSLLAFGNALATVGKGKSDLDGVVLALTQISAKGKVMAQEINQLGERVPQIRKVMEQAFGTADTEKIQKMGLSSQEFIEMIVTELEKLPKVTGGALNDLENLSDAAFISFSKVGESILEVLVPAVKFATSWIYDLGDTFVALPGSVRLAIVSLTAIVAAIGPIAIVVGQATIAIGGMITAYTALTATAAGTAALFGTVMAASIVGIIVVVGALIYELTGARAAYQHLNEQLRESKELSNELALSLDNQRRKILQLAEAMEGADKKKFLTEQLNMAEKNLAGLENQLKASQAELDKYHQTWTGGPSTISRWTGAHQVATRAVEEATERFKAQDQVVQDLEKSLVRTDYPDQLETIRQQTMLNKEADNYIKSIERKIETLARGEAATKVADLMSRGVDTARIDRMNELIAKEEELKNAKAAKTEATKLAKDVDDLTAKLKAQVEAFGGVKYATEIQALADRSATKESLAAADSYSKRLDALKKTRDVATDLANDVEKLTDKLRAEVAELKSGAESNEIFALAHRGAESAVLATARALEIEKKALKEAADLKKDIATFTDNLRAQVATFGMASEEADIYKFALRGATEEQLALARSFTAQKKALEDHKKLLEDAKKINEKFDPKVKFINEYAELNKMLKAGAISTEVFQKATKDLQDDLLEAQEKADVHVRFTVEGNEAVRAGSAEFIKMLSEVEQRAKDVQITNAMQDDIDALQKDVTSTAIPKLPEMTRELETGLFAGDDKFTPSITPPRPMSLLAGLEGFEPVAEGSTAEESEVTLDDTAISIFNAILEAIQAGNDAPGLVINNIGG